jgi:Fe-S cluster assembly protein SufD
MMNEVIQINELPVRTWHFLGVNDAKLAWDADAAVDLGTENLTADSRMTLTGTGAYSRKDVTLSAKAGETLTLIQCFEGEGHLAVDTHLLLEKDARIRLVQVFSAAEGAISRSKITGECADNARIELIQILLGAGDIYVDSHVDLNGKGASMQADIGYLAQKKQTFDMNLCVNHFGKKTECAINASGALKDAASKIFRGTIDFKQGCTDSVGNEKETVLMLGDDVVNKTVPLILCAEENVVGNHGASIGEMDDATLFYFESRGIDRASAEKILARAAVERVTRTIGDSETEQAILNELYEGEEHDL